MMKTRLYIFLVTLAILGLYTQLSRAQVWRDGTLYISSNDSTVSTGQQTVQTEKSYDSFRGLVMAGYQGWFSTPDDGGDRGWYHYQGRDGTFRPGSTNVDLWPDVSEYPKTYESPFTFSDGTRARLFSSRDASTVDTHFRWMQEYGIDGVFVQRFIVDQKWPKGKAHHDAVWDNAMQSARKYGRAVCVMYDLSGMSPGDEQVLVRDIQELARKYSLFNHAQCPQYLYHNGRPLVSVWGVGFNDSGRKYGFDNTLTIINQLKKLGFSIMLGVPAYWRTAGGDALNDPRLQQQIKMVDIMSPWHVGTYDETSFPAFQQRILDDMRWCRANRIDYAPVCFPGFSWNNMNYPKKNNTVIPRNKGAFLKQQLDFHLNNGTQMIYIAMFDEIDEGTAIFKLARKVPKKKKGSTFVQLEKGVDSGHYMKLTGDAARLLKQKVNGK